MSLPPAKKSGYFFKSVFEPINRLFILLGLQLSKSGILGLGENRIFRRSKPMPPRYVQYSPFFKAYIISRHPHPPQNNEQTGLGESYNYIKGLNHG